jgi:hypothetical protein
MSGETRSLQQKIEAMVALTRSRLRRNAALAGVGVLVLAGLAWLTLAVLLDVVFVLPVPLRVAAWLGLWSVLLGVAVVAIVWPLVRPMSLQRVAFRIEHALGNMHNRLVTSLDLGTRQTAEGAFDDESARLVDRLIRQTWERMNGYDPRLVADPRPARRLGFAAIGAAAVVATLLAVSAEFSGNALHRLARPTQPIPPVAWVRLAAEPGDATVLEGDALQLRGVVKRGRVERLTLRLSPDGGRAVRYPMQPDGEGGFVFALQDVTTSGEYRIEGGGTWTAPHRIEVIRRPIITALEAEVHLPSYMRLPDARPVDATEPIAAPVGSRVRVSAAVSGDAAEGEIVLLESDARVVERTQERETVWFDDDTPADAELFGSWRWVTSPVHSGRRAHGFGWSREAYGFSTTLNRFAIADDAALSAWVYLDPSDPPREIGIEATASGRDRRLVWVRSEEVEEASKRDGVHHAAALPEPGTWTRLEVPASALRRGDRAVELSAIRFTVDRGRAFFDRVGSVERVSREVTERRMVELRRVPLQREGSTGAWVGDVPVDRDVHYAVTLRNRAGVASASMLPGTILAIEDEPPTLVVERPGRNVTLAEPTPLPLVVRAFDDFGVAEVRVQVGRSAEEVRDAEDRPQKRRVFDEPRTSRTATLAIDPEAFGLSAGEAMHYRVVVTDTRGQEAVSESFRLALAERHDEAMANADRHTPLDGVLEGLGRLLRAQVELTGGAVRALASLPEGLMARLDADGRLELTDAEGNVLSDQAAAEAIEAWQRDGMTEQQEQAWRELRERMAAQRAELLDVTGRLAGAAEEAAGSPTALAGEERALRAMAARAEAMVAALPNDDGADTIDPAVLERLARLQAEGVSDEAEMQRLESELRQLMAAQQQLAADPDAATRQLRDLMAQMAAAQQASQLQQYQRQLAAQRGTVEALRDRVEALRAQVAAAAATELDEASRQQREIDPEAIEAMRQAAELMAQRRADEPAAPPEPWTPPARTAEAMPVDHDTPDDAVAGDERVASANGQADDAEDAADWWDRPVAAPAAPGVQAEVAERYPDGETRPTPVSDRPATSDSGGGEPEPPTPRQMLDDHQRRLAEALRSSGEQLALAEEQAAAAQQALQQADSAEAMQAAMQSPAAMEAMAMASAAAAAQASGRGEGESGEGSGDDPSNRGMDGDGDGPGGFVLEVDLGDVPLGGAQAVYRLPPAMRQPLIEGMRERGPEAYQRLIDAYYRELSERVREDE